VSRVYPVRTRCKAAEKMDGENSNALLRRTLGLTRRSALHVSGLRKLPWQWHTTHRSTSKKDQQRAACSFGLSPTSQQYFSLKTNQPPAISQQYFSLRTNQHQPSAKNQQAGDHLLRFPKRRRGQRNGRRACSSSTSSGSRSRVIISSRSRRGVYVYRNTRTSSH
jgi:hypothetical protein